MQIAEIDGDTRVNTSNGDHDIFAHYADRDDIMSGLVDGVPIMALCGKIWVPSRDPSKYPVCPECLEIYKLLTSSE